MRKLKFRIWYNNKMSYPHLQETFIGRANVIHMQWTGLLDKAGVEIYEGDILSNCDGGVRYVLETASYETKNIYLKDCYLNEVIGNIYENPELIEKEV